MCIKTLSTAVSHLCTAFEVVQCAVICVVLEGLDGVRGRTKNYEQEEEEETPRPAAARASAVFETNDDADGAESTTYENKNEAADTKKSKKGKKLFSSSFFSKVASSLKEQARASKRARAAAKAKKEKARAARAQAKALFKIRLAAADAETKEVKALLKKANKAKKAKKEAAKKNKNKSKENGLIGSVFNLKATAVAAGDDAAEVVSAFASPAVPASPVAAAAAVASSSSSSSSASAFTSTTSTSSTSNDAPFLRDLITPKHLRYDWEEVHPALAISNGGLLVAAPRRGGRGVRPFTSAELLSNARAVVGWVSLGAAMFAAASKAFDVLEGLAAVSATS